MLKKILVADDEKKIVELIKSYLIQQGFSVVTACDGQEALTLFKIEQPALLILDVMMPGMNGFDVARAIRKSSDTPIIMLTARAQDTDKIVGLELGADDYIVKPFNLHELVARVRAVLRRSEGRTRPKLIEAGDLAIDFNRHEARLKEEKIDLTPIEFQLLAALAQQPGRVFSRLQLSEILSDTSYTGSDRTIDSHIKNLRKKIEPDPQSPQYIQTVHGIGYKFLDSVEIASKPKTTKCRN
jgi:DNA-binding response OmpR family regulator